jgi:hypothetical protein
MDEMRGRSIGASPIGTLHYALYLEPACSLTGARPVTQRQSL